jgi:hypothetical protein
MLTTMNETVTPLQAWKLRLGWCWPAVLGMLVLFLPTLYTLFTGIWTTESYAHGPIILALSLWLLVRQWPAMSAAATGCAMAPAGRCSWPACCCTSSAARRTS